MQVHMNGVEVECMEDGAGVPVVFSHGGSSDVHYWEPQRAIFAARYRFVAYSHRFHGRGRWSDDSENTADAHADDLVAIMRRLGAGPVHLVGFSTAIALRATLRDPEVVRTLTVVEPNVPWVLEGSPEGEAVLAWWSQENQRVDAEAAGDPDRRAALWFDLVNNRGPGAFDVQPPALRRMWLHNFNRARPTAPTPEPLTCERLGGITAPTLVVGTEHGLPYSRQIVEELARCIPGSWRLILPSATHFVSYQAPDVFNAAVLAYLDAH